MSDSAAPRLREHMARLCTLASLLSMGIGGSVLVRWVLALPHPLGAYWPSGFMTPLSGLVALLSGLALLLLQAPDGGPLRQAGGRGLAGLALALCGVAAFSWLSGLDAAAGSLHGHLAGALRMAPNSMLGFGLIALALSLLDRHRPAARHLSPWLSLAALFAGYIALMGYALHLTGLAGFNGGPMMSLAAAIAIGLLAVGTLAARPLAGRLAMLTSETPGGAMLRRLLPALLLAVPLLGFLRMLAQRTGWLSPNTGGTVMAACLLVIALGLLWRNARAVDRIAAERRQAALARQAEAQKRELEVYQRMDTLKDQFFDVVSHELRTPINALTGFGSILEDELAGPLNHDQQRYLGQMLTSADKLLHLVNNLIDLSRIRAGKLTLVPRPVAIEEVVRDVAAQFEPLFAQKEQALDLDLPAELPVLCLDDQRVAQVIGNLLDNASKFSPNASHAALRLRLAEDQLLCEIADQGPGIPPEDLERIFNPFTQRDMSRTRTVGGSGLGLAIAKAIITAHGGMIGVRSAPGDGSVFWFTLPLSRPDGSDQRCDTDLIGSRSAERA